MLDAFGVSKGLPADLKGPFKVLALRDSAGAVRRLAHQEGRSAARYIASAKSGTGKLSGPNPRAAAQMKSAEQRIKSGRDLREISRGMK